MRRLNVLFLVAGLARRAGRGEPAPLACPGGRETGRRPGRSQASRGCGAGEGAHGPSIQDALLRPYHFRFGRPATLTEVAQRLSQDLGSPVVLDLAALERQELKPEDTVKLELAGVRLKTGLKLLLDQVRLTVRVVPRTTCSS